MNSSMKVKILANRLEVVKKNLVEQSRIVCRDIKGNQFKVAIKDLTFRPSVYGVIINH